MKSFQQFRNEISIMDMAFSIGFKFDPKKGRKWPVLVNGFNDDKIIIINPKSSFNQGYFNTNDDNDKGTLIEFIRCRLGKDFLFDKSLSEAMNINKVLYGFKNELLPEDNLYQADFKPQKPFTKDGLIDFLIEADYLFSRNIKRETLFSKEFAGRVLNIRNNDFINIAFPYWDKYENMVGIEKKNFSFDYFVEGSIITDSVWHSNPPNYLEKIVIAESAIDALSYHQVKPSGNVLYVAIGGSLSFGQIKVIQSLKNKNKISDDFKFVSATDNDKMGNKYDEKLKEWLQPDKLIIDKPISKDYNKDLENMAKSRKMQITFNRKR